MQHPCCYQQAVEQILKEQEFDKKNGIDLELKVIDLSQLALLLSSGEVDEDFASLPLIVNANLQGNALQCFAPLNQKFQTFGFVRNDSPYQSLLDLRGEETAKHSRNHGDVPLHRGAPRTPGRRLRQ